MFDVVRDYGTIFIIRGHTLRSFFYFGVCAHIHICVRPRYERRKFDSIDVLKKVYAPFKHDAHDARSLYADQQIVRSHLLHFGV